MFVKRDHCETVTDVVTRNTGIQPDEFLQRKELPCIENIKEAAILIRQCIESKLPITIVGDYDADGITATAILYWALVTIGIKPYTRIPRRFSEGYGLSESIIDEIPEKSLLITVDNGITASTAIEKAKKKGLTVIVTDHHLPSVNQNGDTILPPADIIIDPHLQQDSEFHDICGAVIAYALAIELYPRKISRISVSQVLAAIATVADVMPLVGPNRTLVQDGLQIINSGKNYPGVKALINELRLYNNINEETFGFSISPTINASGRLYDNGGDIVLSLLTASQTDCQQNFENDKPRGMSLAETLHENNEARKRLVKKSLDVAEKIIDQRPIVIYNKCFNEGLIGIIAGHLSEEYHCPAIVFTDSSQRGILKGSGRSSTIHLKDALDSIQDCIYKYGGHAGAAGLSIEKKRFSEFIERFCKSVDPIPDDSDNLFYDLELSTAEIPEVIHDLKRYAPYGEGNPKPIFHMKCYANGTYRQMGEDGSHFKIQGELLSLVGFGLAEKYERLGCPVHIECIGYLKENIFRNKVEYIFDIIDFKNADD